jgi:hypothetical protein
MSGLPLAGRCNAALPEGFATARSLAIIPYLLVELDGSLAQTG